MDGRLMPDRLVHFGCPGIERSLAGVELALG